MGEFDSVQPFRAVLMRVDGINTFAATLRNTVLHTVVDRRPEGNGG